MNSISALNRINFQGKIEQAESVKNDAVTDESVNTSSEHELGADTVELSKNKKYDGPKIDFFRAMFSRLNDEQMEAINRTGKTPNNIKITKSTETGNYQIGNNIFGIISGTTTMPAGYELKKDVLGFAHIVPKDTQGLFVKD